MTVLQDGYLQLTLECNQKCIFCSQPNFELSCTFKKIKTEIDSYKKQGFTKVLFTGGEPTLSPHLVSSINYAVKKKLYTKLVTNGVKLSDQNYCKNLQVAGIDEVFISFGVYASFLHCFDYSTTFFMRMGAIFKMAIGTV